MIIYLEHFKKLLGNMISNFLETQETLFFSLKLSIHNNFNQIKANKLTLKVKFNKMKAYKVLKI
jgi:hypothetical protein